MILSSFNDLVIFILAIYAFYLVKYYFVINFLTQKFHSSINLYTFYRYNYNANTY